MAADALSNSLIVSANKDNLELVKGLLEKVDAVPPAELGSVRLYALKNADAQRIATMLQGLITQGLYKPGAATAKNNPILAAREKVAIQTDLRTNTLIISASDENFAVLEKIIKEVDTADDFATLGDIRLYTLKNANAVRLAPILNQFFTAKRTAEQSVTGGTASRSLPVNVFADSAHEHAAGDRQPREFQRHRGDDQETRQRGRAGGQRVPDLLPEEGHGHRCCSRF